MTYTRSYPNDFTQNGTKVKKGFENDDAELKRIYGLFDSVGAISLAGTKRQSVLYASTNNGEPNYLTASGLNVSLDGSAINVLLAFAYGFDAKGAVDFLEKIATLVSNAWTLPGNSTAYLYIDRDISTNIISYGYSALEDVYQKTAPTATLDQHWYDTNECKIKRYNGSAWETKQRVFVAKAVTTADATTLTIHPLQSRAPQVVNILGNATHADNATKLATPRKINGVDFDGSEDIVAGPRSPAFYQRNTLFSSAKTTVTSPSRLWLNIGTAGYMLETALTLDLTLTASWDATGYTTGVSRAGKDFYVYACTPVSGTTPVIILSANSTMPTGYTEANSRKIGGFHCLCVAVGTIAGHTLTGYVAGDIIPASVWDLAHRPVSEPGGMAYIDGLDLWVDIYLCSYTGTTAAGTLKTQSVYAAVTADGASTEKFHWYKWAQTFGKQKKRMLKQMEFMVASLGSNQGTSITGSADANTAGGHVDTASRRMISNYGLEDCCGFLWQWGAEAGGPYSGTTWENAFDANDTNVGGQHLNAPNRVRLGGDWGSGVACGSRGSARDRGPLDLSTFNGSRGASEPLKGGN